MPIETYERAIYDSDWYSPSKHTKGRNMLAMGKIESENECLTAGDDIAGIRMYMLAGNIYNKEKSN
ncbi:MAG: hypothetical protein ACHQIM_09680 [Sphingobacteriales bacterium]